MITGMALNVKLVVSENLSLSLTTSLARMDGEVVGMLPEGMKSDDYEPQTDGGKPFMLLIPR